MQASELFNQPNTILLDGGMGTMLQAAGMKLGTRPEDLNLENPELIRSIHAKYAAAGSRVVNANTFGASPHKLADSKYTLEEVITAGIANCKQAVAPYGALVTLDAEAGGNISNSTDLTETLADFTQASATKINTLTVKSGENSAAINVNAQAIADVNGNLSAMYNIKVGVTSNGQYYAAGMGIGVQNTPSGMQSQVIFLADRFAVTTMVGGTVTLPFVIQNGQAIIRDTVIGDGTISNAKIGNYIQSNNYVAGSVGWKLDKSGTFENYGSTAGEGAMKQTNQTISVKDGNNVLRVQVGRLTGVF